MIVAPGRERVEYKLNTSQSCHDDVALDAHWAMQARPGLPSTFNLPKKHRYSCFEKLHSNHVFFRHSFPQLHVSRES